MTTSKFKISSKALSVLLCLALLLSCLPLLSLTAFAEGTTPTEKSIMLGASHIEGAQASNVYFGTYQQSSNGSGGYNIDPIKWRVLSNADGNLFLLSDQFLDVFEYHLEGEDEVTWETSTMRSWLNGLANNQGDGDNAIDYADDNFLDTAFSASEQAAIANTYVVNNANPNTGVAGGNDTTDKVFLLSVEEAQNTAYGFIEGTGETEIRTATNTAYVAGGGKNGSNMGGEGSTSWYWLRSPGWGPKAAATISAWGKISTGIGVNAECYAVRPAFNINLSSVLFTSAADNSGHIQFGAPAAYSDSDWKVTAKDSNSFAEGASVDKTTLGAGGALTITHKALSAISSNYTNVTVVLTDASGNLLYYGSVNADTSATSSTVTIPAGLAEGTYTLSVYGEDWNSAKMTDFATGTPFTTSITVVPQYTVSFNANGGTDTMSAVNVEKDSEYTLPANGFTAPEGYQFKGWATSADGAVISEAAITVTADITLFAVWEPNSYTITLDYLTYDSEILVSYGMSFNETYPDINANVDLADSKDNHTFIGWYESTDGGNTLKDTPYDFNTKVTGDIVLYPLFEINTYTVTYKADGEVVETVEVEHGADAMVPAVPEKEGYTAAWDKDGKNITADTEINAVYTEIPATDKPNSPQMGDNTNLWLWAALLFVSSATIALTVYDRKKRAAQK